MDQDVDEEGEVIEVGSDEELDPEDNLRLYLDPKLKCYSEDERAQAEDMVVK